MSEIIPFTYEGSAVRTVLIDDEPWFVLADLCKVLDLSNPTMVAERVDTDDLSSTEVIDSKGRTQTARIVSEPGMYQVIFMSRKPEAVAFRRWITTEVLPEIRKTGQYGAVRQLSPDEIVQQALQITAARVEALTVTVEQQQRHLAIVQPKADAFDRWLSSNVDYSVGAVAKALAIAGVPDIGRTRLFTWLSEHRWAFRTKDGWEPYQTQLQTKRLTVKLGTQLNTRTGEEFGTKTLRITAKGAAKLATLMGAVAETVAELLDNDEEVAA